LSVLENELQKPAFTSDPRHPFSRRFLHALILRAGSKDRRLAPRVFHLSTKPWMSALARFPGKTDQSTTRTIAEYSARHSLDLDSHQLIEKSLIVFGDAQDVLLIHGRQRAAVLEQNAEGA
jgi:hypothetical protein